jgi:16S rRNA (guanine1516-N2)-methyltransferase
MRQQKSGKTGVIGICRRKKKSIAEKEELRLQQDADGLALVGNGQILRGDFTKMLPRIRRGNFQTELLVKASRIKGLEGVTTVMDCTAGLGEDSILLAAAGFRVKLYERDPMIAALLRDSLQRAAAVAELQPIVERMEFHEADSIKILSQLTDVPDVIYLDPMFPARQKSGLVKKKLQFLQQLEQPCEEGNEFLQAAIQCRPKKIVIKRPLKGEFLGDHKPDYSLNGKTIRYDCILLK